VARFIITHNHTDAGDHHVLEWITYRMRSKLFKGIGILIILSELSTFQHHIIINMR